MPACFPVCLAVEVSHVQSYLQVDDPYDFGRIAATNAISDVYVCVVPSRFARATELSSVSISRASSDLVSSVGDGSEADLRIGGTTLDALKDILRPRACCVTVTF